MLLAGPNTIESKLLEGSPVSKAALKVRITAIPQLTSAKHLSDLLAKPSTPVGEVLTWICNKFGWDIIPAVGDLKIPLVPASVQQFVVARQVPKLQKSFDKRMADDNFKSMLLFHDTSIKATLSILHTGFRASSDKRFGPGNIHVRTPIRVNGLRHGTRRQWVAKQSLQ
jgi:hypothetical protein